jgi:hypothetical protein
VWKKDLENADLKELFAWLSLKVVDKEGKSEHMVNGKDQKEGCGAHGGPTGVEDEVNEACGEI